MPPSGLPATVIRLAPIRFCSSADHLRSATVEQRAGDHEDDHHQRQHVADGDADLEGERAHRPRRVPAEPDGRLVAGPPEPGGGPVEGPPQPDEGGHQDGQRQRHSKEALHAFLLTSRSARRRARRVRAPSGANRSLCPASRPSTVPAASGTKPRRRPADGSESHLKSAATRARQLRRERQPDLAVAAPRGLQAERAAQRRGQVGVRASLAARVPGRLEALGPPLEVDEGAVGLGHRRGRQQHRGGARPAAPPLPACTTRVGSEARAPASAGSSAPTAQRARTAPAPAAATSSAKGWTARPKACAASSTPLRLGFSSAFLRNSSCQPSGRPPT